MNSLMLCRVEDLVKYSYVGIICVCELCTVLGYAMEVGLRRARQTGFQGTTISRG
jgi:hypothetical protein